MDTKLALGFPEHVFAEALALKVSTVGVRPVDAVEQLLTQTLVRNMHDAEVLKLRKPPSAHIHAMYWKDRWASLAHLAQSGYETSYVELKFSTAADAAVANIVVEGYGVELKSVDYGPDRVPPSGVAG